MNKVLEFKKHTRNIIDAITAGEYKRRVLSSEFTDNETKRIHKHFVAYFHMNHCICYDYSYRQKNSIGETIQCLKIESIRDDDREEDSFILFTEKKELAFKFVPATMDNIEIRIHRNGTVVDKTPLRCFLTEEQYFMYSTLHDIPEFDTIKELAVMGQEYRGEMMRMRVKMQGIIPDVLEDMKSKEFLMEVSGRGFI